MKKKITSLTLTFLLGLFSWSAMAQTEVTVAGSTSGNGNYATLGAAIAAIPLTGQTGNNITVAINASTTELSTGITIGSGTWSTLKIYPTASDIIVSAATNTSTSPFLILSGAKNVTIDGRLNQTGASSLTLINTSTVNTTSGSTITFDNNAQNNTIKYCTIKGNQQGDFGVISFSANATATNGNGLNTIDHNLITNNGTVPKYGIYAIGNTSFPNIGNQITNNEFKNLLAAGVNSNALFVVGGLTAGGLPQNDNYTISGNSFYQTSWLNPSSDGARQMIAIGSSTNSYGGSHAITDNFIGSNAANCSGAVMTKNNRANAFTGIYISTSLSTVDGGPTSIQNNTIQKINWQNGSNANFSGIVVAGTGDANIGTEVGNTIGDNTTTGSITISNFATGSNSTGIQISSTGTVYCKKNMIGSINVYNGTVAIAAPFNGIQKTGSAGTVTISNNIIGSLTTANSIYAYNYISSTIQAAAVAQNVYPILFQGTGTGTISNNTIANVTNFTTIGNLTGIYLNGTGSTVSVNGNLIHSLVITGFTGSGNNGLSGIHSLTGLNTIANNIIRLGDNNACLIRGVYENTTTSVGAKIYHNTIYISGAPTSGSFISACIHNLYNVAQTAKDYRNNILVNARSRTGATDEHYAFYITSNTTTGLTIDGNNYYASGTGGYALKIGTATGTNTLPSFTGKDAGSLNINPNFTTPGGTLATDYIASNTSLAGVTGTGVTTDYAGTNRTAPTMGAYFIPTIVPVASGTVNSGDLTLSGASQIEVAAGAELNLNSALPTISKIILAPTAKLTMGANNIDAANGVILQSDATGTATLTGENAVSNATVQQYITSGRNWYISPSVSAGTASMLSLGDSVVVWNEVSKIWEKVTSSLIAGRGYIQTAASGHGTTGTVNFTGTTNNGDITTPSLTRTGLLATSGFNLVGNPYPSYLRWSGLNSVLSDANNSEIGTSFWYRTKNDADAYIFVTHNGTSGYTIPVDQNANTTITGIIPPMQAFWVRVTGTTTMKFTNVMRLHTDNALNKFKAPKIDERQRLRLQLVNGSATDEALIYFDAAASNSFDNYDSPKMLNNSTTIPDLYSKAGNEKLVINGLAEATDNMTLPLGFTLKTAVNGLTFKVSELSNFAIGTKVYLIDNELNNQTELLPETQYTFNTTTATSNNENRFSLLFRAPGVTTGVGKTSKPYAQVFVNAANQIVIIAPVKSNYAIYNAMGQLMENGVLNTERETRNMKLNSGVYVVKVNNQSTKVIIK